MTTFEAIAAVDITTIPMLSDDRHIPRKEQAKLARSLFKSLGIKGISVTTPNYSMAQTVDVRLPNDTFPGFDGFEQWQHASFSDMPDHLPAKMWMNKRREAVRKVKEILAKAFPNHDDRSDSQSDYFDYCWCID